MAKRNALGKGLGALIRQPDAQNPANSANTTNKIDVGKIEANPYQPRTHFDEETLDELAASIKQLGIIQPITVREADNGMYQIISGERRYRAALIAGLTEIPAYIRQAEDNNMLEMALVENVQREDLDAIEIAISFQRLIDECQLTQENVSERIGKKRSTIANYLRLLRLPAEIQLSIRQKQISMGHARALVNIEETAMQLQTLSNIIENGLSVRQVEALVQQINNPEPEPEIPENIDTEPEISEIIEIPKIAETPTEQKDVDGFSDDEWIDDTDEQSSEKETIIYEDTQIPAFVPNKEAEQKMKERLSNRFGGVKVDIKREASGAGRIVIPFETDDELHYIMELTEKW